MSNRLKIVIAFLLAASPFAQASAQSDAEVLRMHGTGDWKRVKQSAIDCIKTHPQSCYCRTSLVESQIQLKEYRAAEAELERIKGMCKPDAHQLFLWALVKNLQGNLKTARLYADRMMATGTHHPNHIGLYESILFKMDRSKWLEVSCKNRAFPNASWYLSRGRIGDHSKAVVELQRCLDPKAPVPLTNNPEFVAALLSKPQKQALKPEERMMMAQALVGLERQTEALDWCEPVAKELPQQTVNVLRGSAAHGFKDPKRVLRILQTIEPQCKNDEYYWIVKSFVFRQQDKFTQAVECAEKALKINNSEESLLLRYHIHQQANANTKITGAPDLFLADLRALIKSYPSVRAYSLRTRYLHELGLYAEELQDINAIIALLPPGQDQQKMLRRMADVQFLMGDLTAATTTAKAILVKDPGNEHCLRLLKRIDAELERAGAGK